jgi:hypothetical protein
MSELRIELGSDSTNVSKDVVFTLDGKPTLTNTTYVDANSNWRANVKITLLVNITLSNNFYCQLPAGGIFDGNNKDISVSGLLIDGLFTTNYNMSLDFTGGTKEQKLASASKVQNLAVKGGFCNTLGGFVIRQNQKYFTVQNCYSTGILQNRCGGICGSFAGSGGYCIIKNCYSTGEINTDGGGI